MEDIIRSVDKRSCAAIGDRCNSRQDCCNSGTDHCVGCYPRFDLIVATFGSNHCGCEATGNQVFNRPDLGRCKGRDRHTSRCLHRYD